MTARLASLALCLLVPAVSFAVGWHWATIVWWFRRHAFPLLLAAEVALLVIVAAVVLT